MGNKGREKRGESLSDVFAVPAGIVNFKRNKSEFVSLEEETQEYINEIGIIDLFIPDEEFSPQREELLDEIENKVDIMGDLLDEKKKIVNEIIRLTSNQEK